MALIAFGSRELQTAPRELLEFEPPTAELLNVPVRGPARGVVAVLSTLIVTLSGDRLFRADEPDRLLAGHGRLARAHRRRRGAGNLGRA